MKQTSIFYHTNFLFILMMLVFQVFTSTINAQIRYTYYVPKKPHITKINIEALPLADYGMRETADIRKLYDSYNSFTINDFVINKSDKGLCQSVLKENLKCFELEETEIGYKRLDNYNYPTNGGYFQNLGNFLEPLVVIHNTEKQQFFILPNKNGEKLFGPFKGDPQIEFKNAEIVRKERNSLVGTSVTYLSKHWEFPDEKDAMVNRNNGHYNCAHGHMSGRVIEDMRLDSHYLRFRLENKSEQNLYYLSNSKNLPETSRLYKSDTPPISWVRENPSPFDSNYNGYKGGLHWVALPKNSAFEFEIGGNCPIWQTCAVSIYLNDSPSFFSEIEVFTVFPGTKRREFSKKNAPPKERMPSAW